MAFNPDEYLAETGGFNPDEYLAEQPSMGAMDTAIGAADIIASGVYGSAEDFIAGTAGMIGGRDIPQSVAITGGIKDMIPDYEIGEKGKQVASLISKAYEDYVPAEIKELINQAQSAPEEVFKRGMDTSSRLREKGYDALADVSAAIAPLSATATGAIPTILEGVGIAKVPAVAGRASATTQKVLSPEKRELAAQLERGAIEGEIMPKGGTDLVPVDDPWTTGPLQAEDDLGLAGYTTTTAPYKLNKHGKVIANPQHKIATDAGFSDSILGLIQRANPETRARFRQMVNRRERLYEMPETSDVNDPSIVTGESLAKRLDVVRKVNLQAGKNIDKHVNNTMGDIELNVIPLMDGVSAKWAEKGIKFNEQGGLDFGEMELNKKGQGVIEALFKELGEIKGNPTGRTVHNLKRRIDEDIAYGKTVTGLDAKTQGLLSDFRLETKKFLEQQFPEYGRANAEYSQTIDVLNRIQKAAGKVDLDGEYSAANLGRMSRAIMSQRISRDEIMTAIKDMDAISANNNYKFNDDLRMQVHLANTLDDIWGPSRGTGFAGQSKQGAGAAIAETALEPVSGVAAVGKKAISALKKKQLDDKAKFKAMRELLK